MSPVPSVSAIHPEWHLASLLPQQPHLEEEGIDLVDAEVGGHEILFHQAFDG